MSRRRRSRNIDYLKGIHYPLQTYAWSGSQWAASQATVNGKRPTNGSPIVVTSQPPGAFAKNNTSWQLTFGASHDCVLSLFNGTFFQDTIFDVAAALGGVYRQSLGTADDNIYELADSQQQIQYVVSKNTVTEARQALKYGELDDARGISMRMPLMAAGWGRTVGMRPTDPNSSDADNRTNDDAHKLARETWKYGPIDARWDSRRGVWAAWNDLIVDDRAENLGTMVFSTNPDFTCGFPYLRGKLEDVFRVRRTPRQSSVSKTAAQTDDFAKTAEILTTLNHQWYDPVRRTADLMSNIFLIDTVDGAPSETCGSESTSTGRLEILTTTFFHFNSTFHGPIAFTNAPVADDELLGEMKFNGIAWFPVVRFDPCDKDRGVGTELEILYNNDVSLKSSAEDLFFRIAGITIDTQVTCTTDGSVDGTSDSAPIAQAAQQALEGTAQNAVETINDGFSQLVEQINLIFAQLISELTVCLAELGIDCAITPVTATPPNIQGIEVAPVNAPPLTLDATLSVGTTCDAVSTVEQSEDPFESPTVNNPCPE